MRRAVTVFLLSEELEREGHGESFGQGGSPA